MIPQNILDILFAEDVVTVCQDNPKATSSQTLYRQFKDMADRYEEASTFFKESIMRGNPTELSQLIRECPSGYWRSEMRTVLRRPKGFP